MRCILVAVAMICAAAQPVCSAGYFDGKTVTYIIATDPGGGYDAYARLIGKHLEKKLIGSKVIFKNLPGAGHIIGANSLFAAKPDGYTIGTFNTGLIYAQILQRDGLRFDLNKFSWIGKASADPRIIVLGSNSGLRGFKDLVDSPETVRFSADGIGSASYTETKMLSEGFDLDIEVILGYRGNEDEMAVLRGEVAGMVGSLSSLQSFVDAGNGFVALSIGGDLEPRAADYASTEKARSIIGLIDAMSNLGRLTAAPPGVPDEVVEELRTAYMAVMTDADFLAEAEKLGLPVQPERGDVVAAMVKVALQQSSETVEIISAALNLEVPTVKVSSDLLSLQERNSIVQFRSGDETVTAKISGSRTAILIDGAEADRMALEVGMICEIEFDPNHEENEPKVMECK